MSGGGTRAVNKDYSARVTVLSCAYGAWKNISVLSRCLLYRDVAAGLQRLITRLSIWLSTSDVLERALCAVSICKCLVIA